MVLLLGFEPSLQNPQFCVLTTNTKVEWCRRMESNHRHQDLQSRALPTELLRHMVRPGGLEPPTRSFED